MPTASHIPLAPVAHCDREEEKKGEQEPAPKPVGTACAAVAAVVDELQSAQIQQAHLQPKVLQMVHDTSGVGHVVVTKTLHRLQFYWGRCRRDMESHCRCAKKEPAA
ncbi:hypothetical protein SKAU_G00062640 [Synaphobranchus kaupii]|uniref:Integrase zinc-binding domain-containing protein n=1 Tax=Synaphobranchus kaupii TaxID=118154 RepID=A0A9Q1G6C7_SYNKA|nr:hypothetical protein SKAU_G00062640 [Synaphobranchus kaupii]